MKKIILFVFVCFIYSFINTQHFSWEGLGDGLCFGVMSTHTNSKYGDNKVYVLKINPDVYQLDLLSAKNRNTENKSVKEWSEEYGLVAAINAGMYRADRKTNMGFMKNHDRVNNPTINNNYKSILAFNRKNTDVPKVQIIDLQAQNFKDYKDQYDSFTQCIRMVNTQQQNVWQQSHKKFSMVSIGMDKKGNVLFIFTRTPHTVHDFVNILLQSDLDIYNMMYLEGGPEASFYVKTKDFEFGLMGSYETGFIEDDGNEELIAIPNIIGVKSND